MTESAATVETSRDPSPRPRISIVIPTYNRARHLRRVLHALEHQTVSADYFDVVVVDDGSTDDTKRVLAAAYSFTLHVITQPNQGPAAARNAAINAAEGQIILFIDDDVVPEPDLVEHHARLHEQSESAVIGRLARPNAVRQPVWAQWEIRTLERQYDEMSAGVFRPCARQFFTANASVARDHLVRAGLFDPVFRRAEDVELAYRLEANGLRFTFAPDAVVLHDTPRSLGAWMRVAEQYGYYDVLMWRRGVRYMLEMTAEDLAYARRAPLRSLARLVVGRSVPMLAVRAIGRMLIWSGDAARLTRLPLAACSAVFNLLYWDAFCREVGGRERFWSLMSSELRPPVVAASAE